MTVITYTPTQEEQLMSALANFKITDLKITIKVEQTLTAESLENLRKQGIIISYLTAK